MSGSLGLSLPRLSSTIPTLSLTKPFTPRSLISIRAALVDALRNAKPFRPDGEEPNAALLIPLVNVDGIPGIILEVRGQLRSHAGEVR